MRLALGAAMLAIGLTACTAPPPGQLAAPDPHVSHRTYSAAPPAPLREGERFVELGMSRSFTPAPANGGNDEYRCFLVDPEFADKAFITGSQFLPQNADIVHHAIFFRVMPDQVQQAKELDQKYDGDGWTCFGGPGITGGSGQFRQIQGRSWIAAWAPGGEESVIGANMGYEMPAGSQVIMQMHYNLLHVKGTADRSAIRLRVRDASPQMRPLQTMLLPAPVELPCTPQEQGKLCDREEAVFDVMGRFGHQSGITVAGLNLLCTPGALAKPGPVQTCEHRVREAGTVHAAAGHMHLLGRSIKIELNPGTPQAKVLLDVPVYDFDDQGARVLESAVKVKSGDKVRVTCTHDAALRSMLPALKDVEPRYVVWGEGTSDEMCLGILTWTK